MLKMYKKVCFEMPITTWWTLVCKS